MPQTDFDQQNNPGNDTVCNSPQESILKAVLALSDELNPTRVVTRPDFSPRKGLWKCVLLFLLLVGIGAALRLCSLSLWWLLIPALAMVLLCAKKATVWMILVYQTYAPEKVRACCRFTPSCSDYMLLAIEKYGLCKGICKGTRRLLRCHYPNGGIDYP